MQSGPVNVTATEAGWVGRFNAMGSPCEVLLDGGSRNNAIRVSERVAAEAWRIEAKFSRYLDGNIVDRINRADGQAVEVDDETGNLLDFAATLHELTTGRFDITSGVLRRVWTFDGSDRLPTASQVERVLALVGWNKVRWNRPEICLEAGMEVDLGGIGKEYAVDRCVAVASSETRCPVLVNFGGDLAVTGPPASRGAWSVAIDEGDGRVGTVINLEQGALATSGDAHRYLARDGVRYGHILDSTTGWPVADAPVSVTVAAATGTEAGMLSTMAMLRGADAERFLEEEGARFWCRRNQDPKSR